jgi:3-oxoacyl-[acyl-carrier protein] reductase
VDDIPLGHFGEPADIAHAVAYLCSSQANFVTGSVLTVDGGSGAGRYYLPYSTAE